MKSFISWLGKKAAAGIATGLFFLLTVLGVVYALSFPGTAPAGEVDGGKFMTYFNKILVNTGATSDGMVRVAQKLKQGDCGAGNYLQGFDTNGDKKCVALPATGPGPVPPPAFSLSVTCISGSCFNSVIGATPNGSLSIKRSPFGTFWGDATFVPWLSADAAGQNNATWAASCTTYGIPTPTCNWSVQIKDDTTGSIASTTINVKN